MKKLNILAIFLMTMSPTLYGYTYSDYDWTDFGGHQYALTKEVGNWEHAEYDEAQALNPNFHLVTINDESENDWLTLTFGPDPSTFVWIGLYQDHSDPAYSEPAGGWKWIGDPAPPFPPFGWGGLEPNNQGQEDYGVLESDGQWNDWGPASDLGNWDIYGIIETPEPATLLLLGIGGLLLRSKVKIRVKN